MLTYAYYIQRQFKKKMPTYIVVKLNCFQGVPEKLFIKKSFLVTNAVVNLTTDFKMEEKQPLLIKVTIFLSTFSCLKRLYSHQIHIYYES